MEHLSNAQIAQKFGKQLLSGKIFSHAVSEKKTSKESREYVTVYVAKAVKVPLEGKERIESMLQRGKDYRLSIARYIFGYVTLDDITPDMKKLLEVGESLASDKFEIGTTYSTEPFWEDQKAYVTKNGSLVTDDEPVYTDSYLTLKGEPLVQYEGNATADNMEFVRID